MEKIEAELLNQLEHQSFIEKEMVKIMYQNDAIVENETIKAILRVGVDVDKERLEKWMKLCVKLEAIDESTLVDIAISKKFKELHDKISQQKKELEQYKEAYRLACREIEILEELRHKKITPENTTEVIMQEFLNEVSKGEKNES